jgi:hypothetical protein
MGYIYKMISGKHKNCGGRMVFNKATRTWSSVDCESKAKKHEEIDGVVFTIGGYCGKHENYGRPKTV